MFALPDLPYEYDALEPTMSSRTLHFHHDKHHATYVKTLNELLSAKGKPADSLEAVIRQAAAAGEADKKLFNNAAQAWNHGFFWPSMAPGGKKPGGDLEAAIASSFGGVEKLREAFVKQGAEHFGSGWVWLVADKAGALSVRASHDAHDMVNVSGVTPVLVCDLWEHAYYLDYQNDRKGFLEAWFDSLANWDFAASQLAARGQGRAWRYPAQLADAKAA